MVKRSRGKKIKRVRRNRRMKYDYSKNKYLGKRVRDINRPGLDSIREVKDIANAIVKDYQAGKITYRTAMSRENLLSLAVARDRDFKGKKLQEAKRAIEEARRKLRRLRQRKKR